MFHSSLALLFIYYIIKVLKNYVNFKFGKSVSLTFSSNDFVIQYPLSEKKLFLVINLRKQIPLEINDHIF